MARKPRRCAQSKSCTCPRVTTPIRITRNETQSTSRLPHCRAKTRISAHWRTATRHHHQADVTHVFPSPGLKATLPMNLLLSRPSGTLSPAEGERDGVRGRWVGSRAQGAIKVRGGLSMKPEEHPTPNIEWQSESSLTSEFEVRRWTFDVFHRHFSH